MGAEISKIPKKRKGLSERLKHLKNRILDLFAKVHIAKTSEERRRELKLRKRKKFEEEKLKAWKRRMDKRSKVLDEYYRKKKHKEMGLDEIEEGLNKFFDYVKYRAKSSESKKEREKAKKELEKRYKELQEQINEDLRAHFVKKNELVEKKKTHAKFVGFLERIGLKNIEEEAKREAGLKIEGSLNKEEMNEVLLTDKQKAKLKKRIDKHALKIIKQLIKETKNLLEDGETEQAKLVFESAASMWEDLLPKYKKKVEAELKEVYSLITSRLNRPKSAN